MKRYAVIFIALLALAAPAFAGGGFLRSVEEARKEARDKNRLIFVDLFANWCGWCHRFEKEVVPSEKFQNVTKDKVLLRVDIEDRKEGSELARRFQVTNLPTFLLLTPDLTIAGIIRGYAPADQFAVLLQEQENSYREFQKRMADEASIAKDHEKRLELAKELLSRFSFADADARLQKLVTEKTTPASIRDQAYYMQAVSHAQQSKYDQATTTIKKLITLQKEADAEQSRFLLAHLYIDQKNYPAALDELKRFKTLYPNSQLGGSVDFIIPQLENAITREK